MTEAEWLTCEDPVKLIRTLGARRQSARKLRLYAVAGCHRIWHLLCDERSRAGVAAAERRADDHLSEDECERAFEAADQAVTDIHLATPADAQGATSNWNSPCTAAAAASNAIGPDDDFTGPDAELLYLALNPVDALGLAARESGGDFDAVVRDERMHHAALLRDVFGNPFRPVVLNPAWLTSDVLALARGIYDEKAFDRMPILADALQDAGCDNPDVLDHGRGPGPHVRGCWVIDLVLGKM